MKQTDFLIKVRAWGNALHFTAQLVSEPKAPISIYEHMWGEYKASPWAEHLAQPSGIWASFGVPGPLPPLLLIAFPGFWFFCSTDIHPRKDNIETTMSTKACVGGKESEKINVCPEELHFLALCCCRDSSRGERGKKKDTDEDQSRSWSNCVVQADNELGVFFW